jgi:ABC-type tungstate transport system substrate-binding protein
MGRGRRASLTFFNPSVPPWNVGLEYALLHRRRYGDAASTGRTLTEGAMSLGTILIILVIIYLLGGFSGRFGGYGYGMGHSGMGLGGVILVVLIVLLLLGKL